MLPIGIIDHVEGPADQSSTEIYAQVCDLARLADELGVRCTRGFLSITLMCTKGIFPAPLMLRCTWPGDAADSSRHGDYLREPASSI